MKRKILSGIVLLLFLCGLAIFLYPSVNGFFSDRKTKAYVDEFKESAGEAAERAGNDDAEEGYLASLYAKMKEYNEKIYQNGQADLTDPFAYEQSSFVLTDYGLPNDAIGYIRIPKMDIELPIFLGASKANMADGAVNLGQTSIPIGGNNTNAVLAGHRGYRGAAMFRDIELLTLGDRIYITNLWEELVYEVSEIKVIQPNEIDEIFIQKGRDLVTLLTCHPYSKNYQRYVVYCERVTDTAGKADENGKKTLGIDAFLSYNELSQSQRQIFVERWLPIIGITFLLLLFAAVTLFKWLKKRKK